MPLLVAYRYDPAALNMANYISKTMQEQGEIFHDKNFDLVIIPSPSISADWLEKKYKYDSFIFLSKHASKTGTLALTCHNTGNFSKADFGGFKRQVSIPHHNFQKTYLQMLWKNRSEFHNFEITLEATHHGPTSLEVPSLFVEIGTTEKQWNDKDLCEKVAKIILEVLSKPIKNHKTAVGFGGTHYPKKFTKILLEDEYSLGTIMPKHALEFLDQTLFNHILSRNKNSKTALLDWASLGKYKQKVINLLDSSNLEVIRV